MGQRSTLCTHQMLDLEPEQGVLSSNIVDYPNQNLHLMQSASGNTADLDLHQFREYHDRNIFYGNHYNNIQNCHSVCNLGLGGAAPSNFYAHMFPSSSSGIFPALGNNGCADQLPSSISQRAIGVCMDEYGRNNHFVDNAIGSCKRKDAEVIPGNYYNISGSPSSSSFLSLNCGLPHWDQPYAGVSLSNATTFTPPETQSIGPLPDTGGSQRSVRSRSSTISFQPLPACVSHHNYSLQGTYMDQSFQPANNAWVAQLGYGNSNGEEGCSNWNNTRAMTCLHGRCLSLGAVNMGNMGAQAYQDASSRTDSVFLLNPASLHDFHRYLSPVQNIQVHSFSHHTQIPAPYQYPLNNVHPSNINPSSDGLDSGSRFPPLLSSAEQMYMPHQQLPREASEVTDGRVRVLPSEDAAFRELSRFYVAENVIDLHRDMRLDIDDMSYEELLALEEQIGDVNTGLTEEYILKNLKTSMHVPRATSSLSEQTGFSPENDACIICQVEYGENEIIGTLDCGHKYHSACIKQWLLVKNMCPICKTSALAADKRCR